jgi:transcriptional regulator with XRE-family HTH domain
MEMCVVILIQRCNNFTILKGGVEMGALFGDYFKKKRLEMRKTLRQFCLENGLDPGNISKIERGISPPPQSRGKLSHYAKSLGIVEGSDEWLEFFDIARTDAGRIPEDLLADRNIVAKLPLLFRTIKGQKLTGEQLEKFARALEKLNEPE